MHEAFPLQWPSGYPRTPLRSRSAFATPFAKSRDSILSQLRLMQAGQIVISSNVPIRRDGLPYADFSQPRDPGIAVYFFRKGRQISIACDRWNRVEDNLHAINLTIEAMRGLERWGCSEMLDRAFSGFTALPPPTREPEWHEVLGVAPFADLDFIETIYRTKMKSAHPDAGGTAVQAQRLNSAIAEARRVRAIT